MKKLGLMFTIALAAAVAPGVASSHNAGCVPTGNGKYVFVGSNKNSPEVSEHNPNSGYDAVTGTYYLDLQPGSGDQFGARHAADQGGSAVERPTGTAGTPPPCTAPEGRG